MRQNGKIYLSARCVPAVAVRCSKTPFSSLASGDIHRNSANQRELVSLKNREFTC